MAFDGNKEEDEEGGYLQFTECVFCGISANGEEDGGFDFNSAFAKSSSSAKTPVETSENVEQAIQLRKCIRCKSVAYCSRSCQRNDYPNHKRMCRKIGKDREKKNHPQANEDVKIGHKVSVSGAGGFIARAVRSKDEKKPGPNGDTHSKRGVPAPSSHPRTSAVDPIHPAVINRNIVLHCDSASSPVYQYMGAYRPYQNRSSIAYLYDPDMTYDLVSDARDSGSVWATLEGRGYFFHFPYTKDGGRMLTQGPNGMWCLQTESGERFDELQIPRSRDKLFWDDPTSLLCIDPSEIYSPWLENIRESAKGKRSANIAITPMETLMRATALMSYNPRTPLKYQKAYDYSAWNKNFVLHIDHRTCQLPLPWIDTLTGVYTPIKDKLLNGYPIWSRQCKLTTELANVIPGPEKKYLENQGIRIGHPGGSLQRLMYVRKDHVSSPSVLTLTKSGDIRALLRDQGQDILVASYVPTNMSALITEPASLFTSPSEAFSTWHASFEGQWREIHVAFTPHDFFQQAISLASLDAGLLVENEYDPNAMTCSKRKKHKKKRRKKKSSVKSPMMNQYPNSIDNHLDGDSTVSKKGEPNKAVSTIIINADIKPNNSPEKNAQKRKKKGRASKSAEKIDPHAASSVPCETVSKRTEVNDIEHAEAGAFCGIIKAIDQLNDVDTVSVVKECTQYHVRYDEASCILQHLASLVKADSSKIPPASVGSTDTMSVKGWSVDKTLQALLESCSTKKLPVEPLWFCFNDTVTSPILAAAMPIGTFEWIKTNTNYLVELFSRHKRQSDLVSLIDAGVSVSATAVAALLSSLPRERGNQFNNKIAKLLCANCEITMNSSIEFSPVVAAASHTVGKATKKEIIDSLRKASAELQKSKKHHIREKKGEVPEVIDTPIATHENEHQENHTVDVEKKATVNDQLKKATEKIQAALQWYSNLLDELVTITPAKDVCCELSAEHNLDHSHAEDSSDSPSQKKLIKKPRLVLSSEEVVAALSNCNSEDTLADVESSIDLLQWDSHSEWTIDITEQAHKWFRRHIKKDRSLIERILRRLTLLSTGRWPYVLCKPLKSKQLGSYGRSISLYETKIDAASRIIWEVAIAFSARRSSSERNYCEQVIRVWDIVLDHDNLARAIDLTIDRIEKSHLRGEDCAIYAELDKSHVRSSSTSKDRGTTRIPRVFPMSNELACVGSIKDKISGKSKHFHPASDDPRQFTLLKFYELNAGAIKILLDGQDENMDLPFTPGPKEHEIIHYQSDPQRSLLLMGRSGTGKTTCLVFRMWAQHASYVDGQKAQLQQLFLTKNEILCREVERSFSNMGLAWRNRRGPSPDNDTEEDCGVSDKKLAKFMTSCEWLEALDAELPGVSFFSPQELEQRFDDRKQNDAVTQGVEALLSEEIAEETEKLNLRKEMNFALFKKLWRKIRSGSGSQMDSVLVWREIKSFIKGSVPALQIDKEERSLPQNRFLSLDEYLALPRKQSRMDEAQRREVYDLFIRYEKIKLSNNSYDECDLVYNIAGRISLFDKVEMNGGNASLLPIDSLYVDEVQDFTMGELYILSKLCRDPNNLFLAGDTAQSIAVGVDFRFTDVRQIFYNHFGGIEPKLLQLSHNYRSHAGVLRLAACVVELLYFFFANSLDKLPPDLGLFSGPKPVIMEVTSPADLILMLDGAKRETSRIEFGAHQVVLVRSEEAKKNLPDEFGVDRDWVMTVQQSKGLEFDDVLLYNFFSDSPAEDAWRIVSNYTKEDIDNYYCDISLESSGVQAYDWEDSFLNTRHLQFSEDNHKILETELKMLYTAITRARVNVFIAETNIELSRPMFNYFQRRNVVDVVSRGNSNGLSGVRVFGVMNSVEDWKSRGEYYLQNAEGERQKGCLRLAAKCFDKSGEVKRRDFALAFLAFTEIEEQDHSKKRGKQGVEWRDKLYSITGQLLEARDVGFLNKAALVLLRIGTHDGDAARMFELYARICYIQRINASKTTSSAPAKHEQKYFGYAGKIFANCVQHSDKSVMAIDSFRCYLCAGMYDDAAKLIGSGALHLQDGKTFEQIGQLCLPVHSPERDPISSFQREYQTSERTAFLKGTINKAARVGCRMLCDNDEDGFTAALGLLSVRSDRIALLRSIDGSDGLLKQKAWSEHPIFAQKTKSDVGSLSKDFTGILISDLKEEESTLVVIDVLEERGFLLEAAKELDQLSGSSVVKSIALKTKYVELMLLSNDWDDRKESLISILRMSQDHMVDVDTRCNALLSLALLRDDQSNNLLSVLSECDDSIMWQQRTLKLAFDKHSDEYLLLRLPGANVFDRLTFVHELAKQLMSLASALRKSQSCSLETSHAERHFELYPQKMNPSVLETKPIVNSRLREVLYSEQCDLPSSSAVQSLGFTQSVDREKVHHVLAKYIKSCAENVLTKLNDLTEAYEQQNICPNRSMSIVDLCEYVNCLQLHLLCKKEMTDSHVGEDQKVKMSSVIAELMKICSLERRVPFVIENDAVQECDDKSSSTDVIVINKFVIDAIHESNSFSKLPVMTKKCDIMKTVTHWRTNNLCNNMDFSNKELRKNIGQLERHASTKNDSRNKRRHYFINKKNQIFPRLWLWAVDSPQIINSISVCERIIRTSLRDGLTPISKIDQISLLEVNVVALFGSLSLRYSEVESPPILIPKYSYLHGLLTGETGFPQLQGYGVPLQGTLSAYCHKHFDQVFRDVVVHLEESAAIILENELLSSPEEGDGDGLRFEKALCLSTFLCCNAIIFSTCGKDFDLSDYQRDLSVLPSLPLQGNVKKLVAELRQTFIQKHLHALPGNALSKLPNTFLDLASFFNDLLKLSTNDHIVLCHLKQKSDYEVTVMTAESTSQVDSMLADVLFDLRDDVFVNPYRKNTAFLDNVDLVHDEGEHGRKSDELNAAQLIARFARARADFNERPDKEVNAAIMHFRRWKFAMRIFIRRVKNWTVEKAQTTQDMGDEPSRDTHNSFNEVGDCILERVLDPFQVNQGNHSFFQRSEMVKASFCHAIVDGIECTYCEIAFNPAAKNARSAQWELDRTVSFPMFAQYYNKREFGVEDVNHPELISHIHSTIHQDNAVVYHNKMDHFTTVMTRIAMSLELLFQMVHECDHVGRAGGLDSVWYLNTAEESRALIAQLQQVQGELVNAGVIWSRQPSHEYLWKVLQRTSGLPHHAESFFMKKRDEENSMKQMRINESNFMRTTEDGTVGNPIDELVRGPYLNPEAPTFTPQFGL